MNEWADDTYATVTHLISSLLSVPTPKHASHSTNGTNTATNRADSKTIRIIGLKKERVLGFGLASVMVLTIIATPPSRSLPGLGWTGPELGSAGGP